MMRETGKFLCYRSVIAQDFSRVSIPLSLTSLCYSLLNRGLIF